MDAQLNYMIDSIIRVGGRWHEIPGKAHFGNHGRDRMVRWPHRRKNEVYRDNNAG